MNVTSVQTAEAVQSTSPTKQVAVPAATPTPTADQQYYFSPVLRIDPKSQKVVLEYLNSHTGAETSQYPSEKAISAYTQTSKATPTPVPAPAPSKGTAVNPFDVTAAAQNATASSSVLA